MCGRYALYSVDFPSRFSTQNQISFHNYNVSPGQLAPIIIYQNHFQVQLSQWGINLPFFGPNHKSLSPINIRSETISQKPYWSRLFRANRCLVPANGFFEWQTSKNRRKIPYFIKSSPQSVLGLAGLYSPDPENPKNPARYAILTTAASPAISSIHHRMPLIIPMDSENIWLDPQAPPSLLTSLLSPQSLSFDFHPVSPAVNRPGFDSPDLLLPAQPPS